MMAIVALPESTMPAWRRVGAVRVDAPTPADQVIEVQLNQTPDDRNVTAAHTTNRDARHASAAAAERVGIEQRVVEARVDGGRAHEDTHHELAVDVRLLPVRQGEATDQRAMLAE